MNINEFKEGDIVTRTERALFPNGHLDGSWVGDEFEFVGLDGGIAFFIDKWQSVFEIAITPEYQEGWGYYPLSMKQKAMNRLREILKSQFVKK